MKVPIPLAVYCVINVLIFDSILSYMKELYHMKYTTNHKMNYRYVIIYDKNDITEY